MEVKMALIICLSVVFIFTLGIVSCTLRDKNFKARFDKSNERLKRIIKEQHDELISYREAIKKNDANLKRSLEVLVSASENVNTKITCLKDTEETLSKLKVEVGNLNLSQDKFLKMIDKTSKRFDETYASLYTSVNKYRKQNEVALNGFESKLLYRTSYLSFEDKKRFKEYLHSRTFKFYDHDNGESKIVSPYVKLIDVIRALDFVGIDQWDSLYSLTPAEGDIANGQNTERNQ